MTELLDCQQMLEMRKVTKAVHAILLLSLLTQFFPLGLTQPQVGGKILFDESHHPYFGISVKEGGFADLARELRTAGYTVESDRIGPISYEKLSKYDALVFSSYTPLKAVTTDEMGAVKNFVEKGGGLFLVGCGWSWVDYSKLSIDVLPTNQLGHEFGITVNDDMIIDPRHNVGDEANPIFRKFASHPITEGITSIAPYGYPGSLTLSGSVQAIVMGDEDAYSGYHQKTYAKGAFPPVTAVATYGQGRAVYVGHEGFFAVTNGKGLYDYDNLKFALNIFKWLSQPESTTPTTTTTSTETSTRTLTTPVGQTPTATTSTPEYTSHILIILVGVFAVVTVFTVRRRIKLSKEAEERPSDVEEVKSTVQIKIVDKASEKHVGLEVSPHNIVGSVIDTTIGGLKLPKGDCVRARYEKVKTEVKITERRLTRLTELHSKGGVSDKVYCTIRMEYEQKISQLEKLIVELKNTTDDNAHGPRS